MIKIASQREYLQAMTDLDALLFVWGTKVLRSDLSEVERRQAHAMAAAIEQWEADVMNKAVQIVESGK